jgi:hypothetical protein
MILKINQELGRLVDHKKPVAKAEEARAMFDRYNASK